MDASSVCGGYALGPNGKAGASPPLYRRFSGPRSHVRGGRTGRPETQELGMKTAHRNLVPTTLAAFALAAVLAGSASAARTSAPLDWPERWAAAHVAANGNAESL